LHRQLLLEGAATMNHERMLEPLPAGKLPSWLLRKVLPGSPRDPDILVGPGLGRDAAAIAVGERVIVAKNDPITFASESGAAHLVEVNANDVACMGATPRWLLVTALLPHGVTPADVLNQFAELRETCRHRSVELIGGHTEIVPGLARPILVGMMLGDASPHELLRPGQAQPGDILLVTKGLAIEGTALLARERADELRERIGDESLDAAARLMEHPGISIVIEAEIARRSGEVSALHDPTEGGLASAARELATVSGAGVEIDAEAVPILAETRAVADALGIDPLGMLASGSLLIATRPEGVPGIMRDIEAAGIPVSAVGRLTHDPGEASLIVRGTRQPLPEFAVDEVARLLSQTDEFQPFSPAPNR
jgi:hydrogenase expression/formation protein HypE